MFSILDNGEARSWCNLDIVVLDEFLQENAAIDRDDSCVQNVAKTIHTEVMDGSSEGVQERNVNNICKVGTIRLDKLQLVLKPTTTKAMHKNSLKSYYWCPEPRCCTYFTRRDAFERHKFSHHLGLPIKRRGNTLKVQGKFVNYNDEHLHELKYSDPTRNPPASNPSPQPTGAWFNRATRSIKCNNIPKSKNFAL
jgi:hypothetical protein